MAAAIVFEHGECLCSQHVCRGSAASGILAHNRRLPRYMCVHSLLYLLVVMPLAVHYGVCAHIPTGVRTCTAAKAYRRPLIWLICETVLPPLYQVSAHIVGPLPYHTLGSTGTRKGSSKSVAK